MRTSFSAVGVAAQWVCLNVQVDAALDENNQALVATLIKVQFHLSDCLTTCRGQLCATCLLDDVQFAADNLL